MMKPAKLAFVCKCPSVESINVGDPPPRGALQGMSLEQDGACHYPQARRSSREKLAEGCCSAKALLELTDNSRWDDPNPARLQRLSDRGFVKARDDNKLRVTMKGRAALLLGRR
jgi:hypothetical protein